MQTLYVAGAEPASGKSLVALALMEYGLAAGHRTGFFRPVVDVPGQDPITALMCARYRLPFPQEQLYGADGATARRLATEGREDELLAQIVGAFQRLADQADFVVCLGTDFRSIAPMPEFGFNLALANNLDALMVPVYDGSAHPPVQLVDVVQITTQSIEEQGCPVLAHVINRVPSERTDAVRREAAAELGAEPPVLVLPQAPNSFPTPSHTASQPSVCGAFLC